MQPALGSGDLRAVADTPSVDRLHGGWRSPAPSSKEVSACSGGGRLTTAWQEWPGIRHDKRRSLPDGPVPPAKLGFGRCYTSPQYMLVSSGWLGGGSWGGPWGTAVVGVAGFVDRLFGVCSTPSDR